MTNQPLPHIIEPILLANKGVSMQGVLSLHKLTRLSDQLCSSEGDVTVKVEFGKDHKNIYFIKGHITTALSLQCQRCLKPVIYEIDTDFSLSPVKDDKVAANLPDHYEPLILTEKTMSLTDLIEDEIILNLPFAAKHESNECAVTNL